MSNPWGPVESPIQSGAIGWVTLTEFTNYCNSKHVNADAYAQTDFNTQALNFAFNCIVTHPELKFTDNTVTDWMKNAQMEQAIYLIQQADARDKRLGLQAQGVTRADIIGEYFRKSNRIDLCAGAAMFLSPNFISNGGGWGKIVSVGREVGQ